MKNTLIAPKRKKKIIVNDNTAFQIRLNKILKEEKKIKMNLVKGE